MHHDETTTPMTNLAVAGDTGADSQTILDPLLAHIPAALKAYPKHWAPWVAVWNAERGKFDKIPRSAKAPSFGVSTHKAWWPFDEAVDGFETLSIAGYPGGVGFNMTHVRDLVGIDLDRCVAADGTVDDWAREIVNRAGSYAELSPSGNGLRIFLKGTLPADWTNHERGVEVYAGNAPRFLTVTGARLDGCPEDVQPTPEGFVEWLEHTHKPVRTETKPAPDAEMPDLIDAAELPSLDSLNLPEHALAFLRDGEDRGDGSRALTAATRALYEAGHDDAVVLSLLQHNPHAWDVALRHRHQDDDRALEYLWKHHCQVQSAKAAAGSSADDFEALPDENAKPTPMSNVAPYSVFCANVEAPRYVWHHVLQYGCLYGLTAKWGHGKTAVMLTVALHAATGQVLGRHPVEKCRVLYLCGENPADVQLRAIAIAQHFEISPEDLNAQVYFTRRPFAIDDPRQLKTFLEDAQQYGPFGLVVIDTGPAHSAADEENDNREMHALAMAMRRLMEPLGMPATVALMHPTKEAAKDNLQPRGGGAFSGSIDGELCAWQSDGIIEFFHRTKFRGPGFAPVFFKLQPYTLPGVLDNFGQPVQTILAVETDEKPARAPTGKWPLAAWRALHDLTEIGDDWVLIEALKAKVAEGMVQGEGRDTRKQQAGRAIEKLAAQGFVVVENDKVRVT